MASTKDALSCAFELRRRQLAVLGFPLRNGSEPISQNLSRATHVAQLEALGMNVSGSLYTYSKEHLVELSVAWTGNI